VKDGDVHGGPATFPEVRIQAREHDSGFIEVRAN
jgi:hypothetical protein